MAAWHDRILWRAREQAGWWPCSECGILNKPARTDCVVCQAGKP